MILIDSFHVNTGGGAILLEQFLKKLNEEKKSYYLIKDIRLSLKKSFFIGSKATVLICKNSFQRHLHLFKLRKKVVKVIYFNGIPPVINLFTCSSYCYFQNINHITIGLRYCYFLLFSRNITTWIFQTNYTKNQFCKKFKTHKNKVIPFFSEIPKKIKNYHIDNIKENTFFYPTSNHKHKNNELLIKAFSNLSHHSDIKLKITLEPNNDSYKKSNIEFIGRLDKLTTLKEMKKCEFIIHPSLGESFGMVLIEAAQLGKKVIASDLPYVKEIIKPSLIFNPYDIFSIESSIINAKTNSLNPASLIISNNLKILINLLYEKI